MAVSEEARFNAKLLGFTATLNNVLIENFIRKIGFEILKRLVEKTPVGNPSVWQFPELAPPGYVGGTARGNWQVEIGTIPQSILDNIDDDGKKTISKGLNVMFASKMSGKRIYIINNVIYITALESGHSQQAPGGMRDITLQEVSSIFR